MCATYIGSQPPCAWTRRSCFGRESLLSPTTVGGLMCTLRRAELAVQCINICCIVPSSRCNMDLNLRDNEPCPMRTYNHSHQLQSVSMNRLPCELGQMRYDDLPTASCKRAGVMYLLEYVRIACGRLSPDHIVLYFTFRLFDWSRGKST